MTKQDGIFTGNHSCGDLSIKKHFIYGNLKDITGLVPDEKIQRSSLNIPSNKPLADTQFDQPGEIDLLIASGTTLASLCVGQVKLSKSSEEDLYLQNTRFGWIIGGSIPRADSQETTSMKHRCFLTNLKDVMRGFWEIEEPSRENIPPAEESCEKHFRKNTKRGEDGRYIVALPFNEKITELGDTRAMAERRFLALERRLRKSASLWDSYSKAMQEFIDLGHMTKVVGEPQPGGCYISHHPVIKEGSLTTKLRPVFDASAKSTSGISLNDTLLVGPTIQDDIFSLLLRFRKHNYVLTGDIEKMYRQFWVQESDRKYQRILWRDSDSRIATYEINTVTFGVASAPFLAIRCLHQLADDEGESYPKAAETLKKDMYVDDLLTGAPTFEEALKLRDDINALLQRGKLNMRQWASNEPRLLHGLPVNYVNLKLQSQDNHTIKTLGVHWDSERDQIVYTVQEVPPNSRATKRNILSEIARIFDPLGLLGPVITYAKLIMQELWVEKLDWDDPIPLSIHTKWLKYTKGLDKLNNLSFDRKFSSTETDELQIHGFCDASENAYGACIYIRAVDSDERITSTLLCAKGRVAPLSNKRSAQADETKNYSSVTIPRLELCAAQVLARLYTTVRQAIPVNPSKTIFWSDSTIALHWIRTSPSQLLPFVANRVSDIQARTETDSWRHVRSADNPADLISRGQTPDEFASPTLWKNGPSWLTQCEENWPRLGLPSLERVPETRKIKCLVAPIHWDVLERYSSIVKLKRVIAYCLRFKTKLKGPLSCEELQTATNTILRSVQSLHFAEELKSLREAKCVDRKSKLAPLTPFIDNYGLIRVGGRLRNESIPFDERHAIILPRKTHVTNFLISYEHLRNYHSGNQATLYALRRRYWILDGRNQVRRIIRNCLRCNRVEPQSTNCVMGDLPKVRVTEARPFLNVGVDYCGPFFIKEKKFRNRGRVKVYVVVFVCLSVKAVHLELVSDLTTEGFIAALKRFTARRGLCKNIYSDNGTTFVGANNEFKEIMQLLRSAEHNTTVSNQLSEQGIQWHFMPPHSPNFGGVWEAAVKSFKRHLKRIVGDQLFTFEQLNTFITEVEAIMNSRPLTPISNDPNDPLVLTPGHFLIGNSLTSLPEVDLCALKRNDLSSWKLIQKVRQDFWRRWHKEYLTNLTVRHKWTHGTHEIKEGSLVLINEDNVPPLRWPMGQVIETFPGADGVIRVVRLRTPKGTFIRNTRRLSPLPMTIE
ncbi:uncharacterized protein [Venturia canescens]|uniref:uncharacterized protein n=1 Tax=Venturia canescens TaxID=32260 RepID=UPI001C9C69EB|nr:uncharacterized protein LOC122417762 [Venturia canescens]